MWILGDKDRIESEEFDSASDPEPVLDIDFTDADAEFEWLIV